MYHIRVIVLACLILTYALPAFAIKSKEDKAVEQDVRLWAYKAVTNLLTYNHNNFDERLEINKKYLTQKGCKSFRWILDLYGLSDDFIERKETLITNELRDNSAISEKIDVIRVYKLKKKELLKRKGKADDMVWRIMVPIIVKFKRKETSYYAAKYAFAAHFEILRKSDNTNDFIIHRWIKGTESKGFLKMKHQGKLFSKKKYSECDDIKQQDMDYLRGRIKKEP